MNDPQIIFFGATGYTGQRVAQKLVNRGLLEFYSRQKYHENTS